MPAGSGYSGATGVKFTESEYASASYIDQFKMKAREWHSKYLRLQNMKVPDSMRGEQSRLLNLGDSVKAAIQKVTQAMDAVGLSAIPLIAIGVVGAALAAIAWWNSSYDKFVTEARKKIYDEKYREFIATGASPEQANRMALQAANSIVADQDSGPLALLMRHWQLVAVGVVGLLVYRMMKK